MKIIIPLAGFGSRLRPHTHSKPKPLLHVAGKTVLQHILDQCNVLKFSEIIFITGHLKDQVEKHIKSTYNFPCRFIEQKTMDGTASAIGLAREFITEDVLIIFADTVFDTDMNLVNEVRENPKLSGLIWAQEVEDYQRFGVMVTDENNYLTKLVEKPKEPISKLANIGMYYIKDYKLMLEGIDHVCATHKKGENYLVDAFSYMVQKGSKILIAPVNGWYDCGTCETLLETNAILLKNNHATLSETNNSTIIQPSFIDKDVVIENSVIGPNVSIAKGAVIKDSIVKNSIVDEKAILENVMLTDSTIGANAKVRNKFKKLHVGDSSQLDGF